MLGGEEAGACCEGIEPDQDADRARTSRSSQAKARKRVCQRRSRLWHAVLSVSDLTREM